MTHRRDEAMFGFKEEQNGEYISSHVTFYLFVHWMKFQIYFQTFAFLGVLIVFHRDQIGWILPSKGLAVLSTPFGNQCKTGINV